MIGSYKSRHGSGDPAPEATSGSGSAGRLAPEVRQQVQSQQEELERLQKDLSSQKVTAPRTRLLPHRAGALTLPMAAGPDLVSETRAFPRGAWTPRVARGGRSLHPTFSCPEQPRNSN